MIIAFVVAPVLRRPQIKAQAIFWERYGRVLPEHGFFTGYRAGQSIQREQRPESSITVTDHDSHPDPIFRPRKTICFVSANLQIVALPI